MDTGRVLGDTALCTTLRNSLPVEDLSNKLWYYSLRFPNRSVEIGASDESTRADDQITKAASRVRHH